MTSAAAARLGIAPGGSWATEPGIQTTPIPNPNTMARTRRRDRLNPSKHRMRRVSAREDIRFSDAIEYRQWSRAFRLSGGDALACGYWARVGRALSTLSCPFFIVAKRVGAGSPAFFVNSTTFAVDCHRVVPVVVDSSVYRITSAVLP